MKMRTFEMIKKDIGTAMAEMDLIYRDLENFKAPENYSSDHEIELAQNVEYIINRLRNISSLLRTRQDDREPTQHADDEEEDEADNWKKGGGA